MDNELATKIEQLHSFAAAHDEMAFAHMCVAALQPEPERWAVERVARVLALFVDCRILDADLAVDGGAQGLGLNRILGIIRATDTTRPGGELARSL